MWKKLQKHTQNTHIAKNKRTLHSLTCNSFSLLLTHCIFPPVNVSSFHFVHTNLTHFYPYFFAFLRAMEERKKTLFLCVFFYLLLVFVSFVLRTCAMSASIQNQCFAYVVEFVRIFSEKWRKKERKKNCNCAKYVVFFSFSRMFISPYTCTSQKRIIAATVFPLPAVVFFFLIRIELVHVYKKHNCSVGSLTLVRFYSISLNILRTHSHFTDDLGEKFVSNITKNIFFVRLQ